MHVAALRILRPLAAALAVGAGLGSAGCKDYSIQGRVLETGSDTVSMVPQDSLLLEDGTPVSGARVLLFRDPDSLNRTEVATTVADRAGRFTLKVGAFGTGWMDERWLIQVRRGGYTGAEDMVEMPLDPEKWRVLATLSRGTPRKMADPVRGADVLDNVEQFKGSASGGR